MNRLVTLSGIVVLVSALAFPAAAQEAKQANQTLFTHVNVFDGQHENVSTGMSVLLEGNKITKIAESIAAPAGSTVIDGGGRTLMPGSSTLTTIRCLPR